ncbi:porin [Comamonas guangdongensis]|uniref:Porin n=1 Tax=Comamonas guangdongensis TaxID=510515 RepID=A0ABV3ZVH4_9BURK
MHSSYKNSSWKAAALLNLKFIAMKKSLIALAAMAVSSAAMAQSSVTIYGVVDTSVAYEAGGAFRANGNDWKIVNSNWSGLENSGNVKSRLGFKGTEDLGGGLKANFVLEGDLTPDTGATALSFGRQSTVGLSSNFGEVRLGREMTAAYKATSRYDVMGQAGYGASYLWGREYFLDNRVSNAVTYVSPNFNGVVASMNYGFGEDKDAISGKFTNSASRYLGAGITYDNGPLSLGLALEQLNKGDRTAFYTGTPPSPATDGLKTTAWSLGGSYDLGVVKIATAYRQSKQKSESFNPSVASLDLTQKGFMLGVSAPVGAAGEIRASWNQYRDSWRFTGNTSDDMKANALALGYVHNLSKRTALYGTLAYIKNKNKTNPLTGDAYNMGQRLDGSHTRLKENGSQSALQIGIRHSF